MDLVCSPSSQDPTRHASDPSTAPAHLLETKSKFPVDSIDTNGDNDDADSAKGLRELGVDVQDPNGQHHPIAEFLYQLTKMLTDDNSEIIEWADGRIKVHFPERLEAEALHKYFRHSKFASFQRQLNYFGFRKIAGKGKMSPCSYVNEAASSDIRSLLLIKRKTNGSAARKAAMQQRAVAITNTINPALLGMNLSALGAAAPQAIGNMNGQDLSNAMALLSENALRAGLGQLQGQQMQNNTLSNAQLSLLALQQHQLQQQLQQHQQQQQLKQLVQGQGSSQDLFQMGHQQLQLQQQQPSGQKPSAMSSEANLNSPSLEQLHAQLASLAASQHQQNMANISSLGASAMNLAQSMPALKLGGNSGANLATAALQAQNSSMPATAAMNAASATAQATNNLFESAINLKSLLQEHQESVAANRSNASALNSAAGQALLNRLPSSSAIFPDSMSSVSLGNLLGSSNRLNSLLSLNSFMGSREPSLADFAVVNNMTAQLAAAGAGGNPQFSAEGFATRK